LHQSRHAAQSRGNTGPRRSLCADGVSAVHQWRHPGRPGPRSAESRASENAARRQLRVAPRLEAADAKVEGLPLLKEGAAPRLKRPTFYSCCGYGTTIFDSARRSAGTSTLMKVSELTNAVA